MQVFLVVFQTCTTVSSGDHMQPDLGRTIHYESHAGVSDAPAREAGLLQPATNLFFVGFESLPAELQNPIHLPNDLSDENLDLALVAETQEGLDRKHLEAIQTLRNLLLGLRPEQRIKFCLEIRRTVAGCSEQLPQNEPTQ